MALTIRGRVRALSNERRRDRFLAWHMLAPHFGKGFPSLADYLELGDRKPTPAQTADEFEASMMRWEAYLTANAAKPPPPK